MDVGRMAMWVHMGRRAYARHARLLDQEEAAVVNTVNIAEGAGRVV